MQNRCGALAVLALLAPGCSSSDVAGPSDGVALDAGDPPYVPPPESCDPVDLDNLDAFAPCSTGSGIFGTWVDDDLGLPAYDYGLDENADDRAAFFNTESKDRRDHWAPFGNARVNALFYNDGPVEVTTQDRGVAYLNKVVAEERSYGGGFSFVDDGEAVWSTAYKWRPGGSRTTRRFGMGYAETTMEHRGVLVSRRLLSPAGDAPVVIDEITLENRGADAKAVRHYEYWDVRRRPVEIDWAVSGKPLKNVPAAAEKARDDRNGMFDEGVSWDSASRVLGLRRTLAPGTTAPPADAESAVDYYPGDPFVAALIGDVADAYTDDASFFGDGDPATPAGPLSRAAGDGLADGAIGKGAGGLGQPRMLTLRSDVSLAPGEKKTLRFAYGYAPMGEPFVVDPSWRDPSRDLRAEQAASLRKHLFYFGADRDPVLHREMAWHSYEIEASVGFREYEGVHVVPQGSAYLYLHGADGAARDFGLFAVPMVFTHPELAREELALMAGMQRADDRRFMYALQGNGELDDALGLHAQPSDLDLFYLWAIGEYLGATGDTALLDAPAPYWPKGAVAGTVVWDHVHDAVRHLVDAVGTGEHGLVRLQDGDWNDGIALEGPDKATTVAKGESVPNTQMAIAVLPRVADLVQARDAALADEIRAHVTSLTAALPSAWAGTFFGRAYFGDGKLAYADAPSLEAQVWSLVADAFPPPADRASVLAAIEAKLDDPSPAGATLTPDGQVWPAISGLLTWGYAKSDPERAWKHLAKNTMAAHAVAYPSIWYGIWSGPDGLDGPTGDRPGEAWYSIVTPMTDFPVMNNNQHTMPILAALRIAGVEVEAGGLSISPHVPGRAFALGSALLDLSQHGPKIAGEYRPSGTADRRIRIVAPPGSTIASAAQDGTPVAIAPGATSASFAAPAGSTTRFEVDTSP